MPSTYPPTTALRAAFLSLFFLTAAACGEDEPPLVSGDRDSGQEEKVEDAGPALECTNEGKSVTCTCSKGVYGKRTCTDGEYSACKCEKQDGGKEPSRDPLCKAGYFTGNFKGKYRPGAFGGGIVESGFEVDIEGGTSILGAGDRPPLSFTLEEELAGGGEFATFTVKGGCMQGLARAVFITENPFIAKLTGSLDCETGEFVGELDGYYTLLNIPGANFYFRGPLTAQFELANESLQAGEWEVDEPPSLTGMPQGGGHGTWDAKWTAAKGPEFEVDPCDTVPIKDDAGVPLPNQPPKEPPTQTPKPDASAPAGDVDAGTP